MSEAAEEWFDSNFRFTVLVLDEICARLERFTRGEDLAAAGDPASTSPAQQALAATMAGEPAISLLASVFGLDGFARDVVLFCLGFELDGRFAPLVDAATVGLALEVLPDAYWGAFDPTAPLRRWEIIDVDPATPLVEARIRLDQDIVSFLLGRGPQAPRSIFVAEPPLATVLAAHVSAARHLSELVLRGAGTGWAPVVELHGADGEERRLAASLCAGELGLLLASVDVRDLPAPGPDLDRVLLRWARNARLTGEALLIEDDDLEPAPEARTKIRRVLALVESPLFVSGPPGLIVHTVRPVVRHEVEWPSPAERLAHWDASVTPLLADLEVDRTAAFDLALAELAEHFRVGAHAIETIVAETRRSLELPDPLGGRVAEDATEDPSVALLERLRSRTARHHAPALESLAERVPLDAVETLVLGERELAELAELELHIRYGYLVNRRWGLGRGRGGEVAALFAGPSGTGKTLAARVLARNAGLDLFRVDLSAVVSKYIGETEKNLRRIFDAANAGGVILLFDEADALFGKRSEVRDSHDRYANVEIAYLLQKMEASSAPSILTTNMKDALDPAFIRRLRFIVEFPFPDEAVRRGIWESVFPAETPVSGIRPDRLADLVVTGGAIRNIAVRAAFLAARDQEAVGMQHLLEAARSELRKTGRSVTAQEVAGWVEVA